MQLAIFLCACIFLFIMLCMYLWHKKFRNHYRVYRFVYLFATIMGFVSVFGLIIQESPYASYEKMMVFYIFFGIVFAVSFVFNLIGLLVGSGELLTSTLTNVVCAPTVSGTMGSVRVTYKLEGQSLEGHRNKFILQRPEEIEQFLSNPVAPTTVVIVRYYEKNKDINSINRID